MFDQNTPANVLELIADNREEAALASDPLTGVPVVEEGADPALFQRLLNERS